MGRTFQVFIAALVVVIGLVLAFPYSTCGCSKSNESPTVANLRTINTAEVTYQSSSGGSYGTMTDLITAGLLDDTFARTKSGYDYTITLDELGSGYTAEAVPTTVVRHSWFPSTGSTNTRLWGYYSVPDAVVRYSTLAPTPAQTGKPVE